MSDKEVHNDHAGRIGTLDVKNRIVLPKEISQLASLLAGVTQAFEELGRAHQSAHPDADTIKMCNDAAGNWLLLARAASQRYMLPGVDSLIKESISGHPACLNPRAFMKKAEIIIEAQLPQFANWATNETNNTEPPLKTSKDEEIKNLKTEIQSLKRSMQLEKKKTDMLETKIQSLEQKTQLSRTEADGLNTALAAYAYQTRMTGLTYAALNVIPGPGQGWSAVVYNDHVLYLPAPTAHAFALMLREFVLPSNFNCLFPQSIMEFTKISALCYGMEFVKCVLNHEGYPTPVDSDKHRLEKAFQMCCDRWMRGRGFDLVQVKASVVEIGARVKVLQRILEAREGFKQPFLPIMTFGSVEYLEIFSLERETTFEECVDLMGLHGVIFQECED
ncbi:hypothetical protein CKAH01_01800 [Colletotrichum kahawae]|uniref:Uncharacterized protein n=1 Tax=Colletotrichum kahawae TaxID=34407 RepID=A0AAE0D0U8_COLKA|nr:hypothetical protein CKAH01_01800 [Colletotrichum kahawae]